MKVAILIYPGMTALDAIGPYEVFNGAIDIELQFVWKEVGPVLTDSGVLAIGATHTLTEVTSPDILLVPGSTADTPTLMADSEIIRWIQEVHKRTQFTTSVCSGALILAAAGVLEGLPATTHWAGMSALKRFGADPRPGERIVHSGKVITAAGVSAGIDMALYLLAELRGEQEVRVQQLLIEYDPQPPFNSGHMSKADETISKQAKARMRERSKNPRNLISLPKVLLRQWTKWVRARA